MESGRASEAAGDCPSRSAGSQTGARGGGARWRDSKPQAGWCRRMGSRSGDLDTLSQHCC